MDLSFSFENARYAIGKFDRVTIDGFSYRLHMETEVGFVFIHDDDTQLAQSYTHEEMRQFGSNHDVRVERGYFDPHSAVKRQLHSGASCSSLSGGARTRLSKREAYCQAALDMHREGLMSLTDTSIKANRYALTGRATELAENLNPTGAKNPSKSEDFSQCPSARSLRRWF